MGYNQEDGEYRVAIPEDFYGKSMAQCLPNSIFEVYMTHSSDQSFIYGQGQDELKTSTLYQSFQLGFSEIVPDSSTNPHQFQERVF